MMVRSKKILSLSAALALLVFASPLTLVGQEEEMAESEMAEGMSEGSEAATSEEDEGPAVEFSVEDLQRMASLPPSGTIGKESQEDLNNPINIFNDRERVEQMLGEKPKFIYFPDGVDPMIIPWVRNEIIAKELWDEARLAESTGDLDRALEILNRLSEEFMETEVAPSIPAAKSRVTNAIISRDTGTTEPTNPVIPGPGQSETELPLKVEQDTFGVIMADDDALLIWGTDALRVGDTVPGYGGVRVKSIAQSEVVYLYQDEEFPVEIEGGF